jgi:hypothetical protein
MTSALDNLLVVAPDPVGDERLEAWLEQLDLLSALAPIEDFAPAFSKRYLSLNVSLIRPSLAPGYGATWPEIVSNAGGMVDPIEKELGANLTAGAAVWLEATAEHALAASFAAHSFGGEQAIRAIIFDLTPGAVRKFLQPMGRQALARICAAFEGSGVAACFLARERSSGEALLALEVPTILDAPALARSGPRHGNVVEHELDLGAVYATRQTRGLVTPLCERILELCDLRAASPLRVVVRGTAIEIARAGAYIEDLARSRISLRLEVTHATSQGIGLDALRASPILAAAFDSCVEPGRESDPDAMDSREIRLFTQPAQFVIELSRRLVDQIGHGLKDISLDGRNLQLDVRP